MIHRILLLVFMAWSAIEAQPYTLGVGVYPGDPSENFGPTFRVDRTYRNLTLDRPVYQSSSYDYNLTGQLITDGIKDTKMPRWVVVSTSQQGELKKNEREWLLDHNWFTSVSLRGTGGWVQLELAGGDTPREVDRVEIDASVRVGQASSLSAGWTAVVSGSDDGQTWTELGRASGADASKVPPGRMRRYQPSVPLKAPSHSRFYRVSLDAPGAQGWMVSEIGLFDHNARVEAGGPYDFTSAWKSAGTGEEWVYVDLGAECTFDRVALHWIRRAAEGVLQVSSDAANWKTVAPIADDMKLASAAQGRYVRVLLTKSGSPDGYILSEMEVYGRGGPVAVAKPAVRIGADGRLDLAGGAWRIQRDSLVTADGAALSKPGFHDADWLVATVPGTVLTSYYNAGALPDPNFGDNQLLISDSFFYADFWYRNEFTMPPSAPRTGVCG